MITEVDASEYEPQVVELPPSPLPGAGEQEGRGEEEDDGGKEEAESQNNEGVSPCTSLVDGLCVRLSM